MKLSRKELENTICIACGKRFGYHTKQGGTKFNLPTLMECMFRIQGTYVEMGDRHRQQACKKDKAERSEEAEEIEALCSSNVEEIINDSKH